MRWTAYAPGKPSETRSNRQLLCYRVFVGEAAGACHGRILESCNAHRRSSTHSPGAISHFPHPTTIPERGSSMMTSFPDHFPSMVLSMSLRFSGPCILVFLAAGL